MAFGIYIHIPHCLQVCPYCDFTKYEHSKIMPLESYVTLIRKEIRQRARDIIQQGDARSDVRTDVRIIDTIYFGGGTPSLLQPNLILAILDELANQGFQRKADAEFTVEINPGTIDLEKLKAYQSLGVNRFSVGAQTFNQRLLSIAGRQHSAQETVTTLSLLRGCHTSLDLLFALPTQTLAELDLDIAQAIAFDPAHLSTYYLTVPEHHPMSRNRATDDVQVEMFNLLEDRLGAAGYGRYEISSFAKPGFEAKHNHLYWTDQEFWGLGVSAHSYLKRGPWGLRFWNPTALPAYVKQIDGAEREIRRENRPENVAQAWAFSTSLPEYQREHLQLQQALTDFCHVSLRMTRGLAENAMRLRFGDRVAEEVVRRFKRPTEDGLIEHVRKETGENSQEGYWRLTRQGRLLSNVVFQQLTFLAEDFGAH